MSKNYIQRLVFPIIVLLGLTLACRLSRENKNIRVDITPLAVLETPLNLQLPTSDRVSEGYYKNEVQEIKLVEVEVLMWRNSDRSEYWDLGCRGYNNLLVINQASGNIRYYCETIAHENINEYTLPQGNWDSDIVIQKGDIFINIINSGDPFPDGKIEEETVEMIARVWKRRIQDGTQNIILPGEYYYEEWCAQCHSIDGSNSTGRTFLNLYGSQIKLDNGETVTADEDYIRTSILKHQDEIVAEHLGKKRGSDSLHWLLEQGLNDLIDFIISVNS